MRWADEWWVRLYTRDTSDWLALGWDAQALLMQLFRKVNRAGQLELGRRGAKSIAILLGQLHLWESRLEPALRELIEDRCVVIEGSTLTIPNFVEAQTTPKSEAQRQRERTLRVRDENRESSCEHPSRFVSGTHASPGIHQAPHAAPGVPSTQPPSSTAGDEEATSAKNAVHENHQSSPPDASRNVSGTHASPAPLTPAHASPLSEDLTSEDLRSERSVPVAEPTVTSPGGADRPPEAGARSKLVLVGDEVPPAPRGHPGLADVVEALDEIARPSRGRFVPGTPDDWAKGHVIAVRGAKKRWPDMARWRGLGEWLAAGGRARMDTLSMSWAASSDFASALVESSAWVAAGRPPLAGSGRATRPAPTMRSMDEQRRADDARRARWLEEAARKKTAPVAEAALDSRSTKEDP